MSATEAAPAAAIRARLGPAAQAALGQLRWCGAVDSSNSVLLREAAGLPDRAALVVDAQQAGRGRRGRVWQSPAGANLYLSLFVRLQRPIAALGGFSLALGIGCAEALRGERVAATVKWPNDLLVDGRKLGGLLVELAGERDRRAEAVLGLGLNLRMPVADAQAIDQPWTDLATLGVDADRERWAAVMLQALLDSVAGFESGGFAAFRDRWDRLDALVGRPLRVQAGDRLHEGINGGIDADGGLRLLGAAGELVFHSAEVSVRGQ
jgi:BirA family transcriptional regulator, biotin operon repressor / biotin---[acetyl-CoA-carboxylase] ligase